MGWFFNKKEETQEEAPGKLKQWDIAKNAGNVGVPVLFIDALRHCGAVEITGVIYYQDVISKIDPFRTQQFKLLKANKKNTPNGVVLDDGTLLVFHDGEIVGHISPWSIEKNGFKSAKLYYGYVMPPCVDKYEGFPINGEYTVMLFPNGIPR